MAKEKLNKLKDLEKAITLLDDNQRKIASALLDKATYLEDKLEELQEDIDTYGLNIEMQQGTYSITRANPSCETYNKFLKHYTTIVKQLNDMLPKIENNNDEETSEFAL